MGTKRSSAAHAAAPASAKSARSEEYKRECDPLKQNFPEARVLLQLSRVSGKILKAHRSLRFAMHSLAPQPSHRNPRVFVTPNRGNFSVAITRNEEYFGYRWRYVDESEPKVDFVELFKEVLQLEDDSDSDDCWPVPTCLLCARRQGRCKCRELGVLVQSGAHCPFRLVRPVRYLRDVSSAEAPWDTTKSPVTPAGNIDSAASGTVRINPYHLMYQDHKKGGRPAARASVGGAQT